MAADEQPLVCDVCGKRLSPKLAQCPYCRAPVAPAVDEGAGALSAKSEALLEEMEVVRPGEEPPSLTPEPPAVKCLACGTLVSPKLVSCPSCGLARGAAPPVSWLRRGIVSAVALGLVVTLVLVGIGVVKKARRGPDEVLLSRVVAALAAKDFAALSAVSVMRADFIVDKQLDELSEQQRAATGRGLGLAGRKLVGKQTFGGEVLRPEQVDLFKRSYERAVLGGDGYLDFEGADLARAISLGPGSETLLDDTQLTTRAYAVALHHGTDEVDGSTLYPRFVIVDFHGEPRLLDVVLDVPLEIVVQHSPDEVEGLERSHDDGGAADATAQ